MKNIYLKLKTLTNLKDQLLALYESSPKTFYASLNSKKYDEFNFLQRINEQTPLLSDDCYTIATKIYWILNDIQHFPICENDGKPLNGINVKNIANGYGKILACCKDCWNKIRHEHAKASNVKKYGASNPFQFAKEKIRETNVQRYGNACPSNNVKIREEIEKNNIEKYGVKSFSSTDEFKNKTKHTNLSRYGVECVFQAESIRQKIYDTNLKRYGVKHPSQSKAIQAKTKQTFIDRYGENYAQEIWGKNGNDGQVRRSYREFICNSDDIEPLFTEDDFLNGRRNGISQFEFKCKKCGNVFTSYWDDGHSGHCPKCVTIGCSNEESQLFEFLKTCVDANDIKHCCRDVIHPYEIDFFIKNKNVAIEFDGLYWHSSANQLNNHYHLMKTELCEKQGIQLIHVFENEWLNKRDIVKSRLANMLGKYDKTIYARMCEIKEIGNSISNDFIDKNHIQGHVNAKVSIGLFHLGELISVMTFGKSRFNKKYEWELLRFCNKLNYHVPGGASKLLRFFERTYCPTSLVSYADRRWSIGKLYAALGFNLDHKSAPNYWYFKSFKNPKLESRIQFQKHKLKNILPKFDESRSEFENMSDNGFYRIFDCGNLVFEKLYTGII